MGRIGISEIPVNNNSSIITADSTIVTADDTEITVDEE
jgi:hypothetical protein